MSESYPWSSPPDASSVLWSTQTLWTLLSMPMASPPLEVGEPDFFTFCTVTFCTMMLLDSRMWMPIWSNTAPPPTPMSVTLLICLSSMTPAAVLQLSPETLAVFPTVIVPSTWMMIGVLLEARLHSAVWIAVPVLARTVWPPAPPVVPPFWVAYPVTPPVAADACGTTSTTPSAAAAPTAPTVSNRNAAGRLIIVSPSSRVMGLSLSRGRQESAFLIHRARHPARSQRSTFADLLQLLSEV